MTCNEQCRKPTGLRQAHCGVCHRTFTGISTFDQHRRAGVCVRPEHRGMTERQGLWGHHGTNTRVFDTDGTAMQAGNDLNQINTWRGEP
jgi:hypothetical protein